MSQRRPRPDDMQILKGKTPPRRIPKQEHREALLEAIGAVTAHTHESFQDLDVAERQHLWNEFYTQVIAHRFVAIDNPNDVSRAVLDACFIMGDSLSISTMVFVLAQVGVAFLERYVSEHEDLLLWRGETDTDKGDYYCGRQALRDGYDRWLQYRRYIDEHGGVHPLVSLMTALSEGRAHFVPMDGFPDEEEGGQRPTPRFFHREPGTTH